MHTALYKKYLVNITAPATIKDGTKTTKLMDDSFVSVSKSLNTKSWSGEVVIQHVITKIQNYGQGIEYDTHEVEQYARVRNDY